jgi:hypothetical protein
MSWGARSLSWRLTTLPGNLCGCVPIRVCQRSTLRMQRRSTIGAWVAQVKRIELGLTLMAMRWEAGLTTGALPAS